MIEAKELMLKCHREMVSCEQRSEGENKPWQTSWGRKSRLAPGKCGDSKAGQCHIDWLG